MNTKCRLNPEIRSDQELVSLIRDGDAVAFNVLSERYKPLLYGQAGKYADITGVDVEDFIQEGMLALYRAVQRYDSSLGAKFGTYATACICHSMTDAVRIHMRMLRSRAALPIDKMDEAGYAQLYSPVEDSYMDRETTVHRTRQIESVLSDFERQVLMLYLRGHSYQQISAVLRTATKSVDNALQRVRRKLRPDA